MRKNGYNGQQEEPKTNSTTLNETATQDGSCRVITVSIQLTTHAHHDRVHEDLFDHRIQSAPVSRDVLILKYLPKHRRNMNFMVIRKVLFIEYIAA